MESYAQVNNILEKSLPRCGPPPCCCCLDHGKAIGKFKEDSGDKPPSEDKHF